MKITLKNKMLDTVILNIPRGQYRINASRFSPNADILRSSGNYLVKCVSNPSAQDKKNGVYRPRLTLMKRMTKKSDEIPLKIEFSVAKLIYSNNVEEVRESDFWGVLEALREGCRAMGADVSMDTLKTAKVSAFHPSKNIELKEGYTSSFVITELHKIDVSKKIDLNRDSFRNSGHSLQFYTNSHSLVVYDKIQDLRKPEKRAMDKDQNPLQASLFDTLGKKEKKQILRIEARLAKKVKMNATLARLGYKPDPTFEEIFKRKLCQQILIDYWQELVAGKHHFLFEMESNPMKTLEKVYKSEPKIKPKQAVYLVGLWTLSKQGIRDTRAVVERNAHIRTWYRIAKDLPLLDKILETTQHGWVRQVEKCLNTFRPLKLSTTDKLLCKEK